MRRSVPTFDRGRLLSLISELLDGEPDEPARDELNALLKASPEARALYRKRMELHADLHLEAGSREMVPSRPPSLPQPAPRRGLTATSVVAMLGGVGVFFLLGAFLVWKEFQPQGFATLENVEAARWESSDHGTSTTSRIGPGTLRLSDGLATIRFDSGAVVTLEGPSELRLMNAMHCVLKAGILDAGVPPSAAGFRVDTPWTSVVDRGTRFSVVVDPKSSTARTQVYEGRVEVEHLVLGEQLFLEKGEGNLASESQLGEVFGEDEQPTLSVDGEGDGKQWTLLESSKDAYLGSSETHVSSTLLLVKNGSPKRISFLGFDVPEVENIAEAELRLHFAPTGFGMAAFVPDATFSVHGLTRPDIPWKGGGGSVQAMQKVGKERRELLGQFVVPQGVQSGPFRIEGQALARFLQKHAGSEVTLVVTRDTAETSNNGLVHGFASRRHPTLPAPTLAILPAAR